MKKVIANVYEEDDYSVFKKLPDNRDLLEKRLSNLIESISVRFVLNPIVCNKNMEIVDGQGRFDALKALNKPIPYIVDWNTDIEDCRRMNEYNSKWSGIDFIKSYAKTNRNYANLLYAVKKTGKSISIVLRCANRTQEKLKEGGLTFTDDDIIKTCNAIGHAEAVKQALLFDFRLNAAFYYGIAVCLSFDKYDPERMIRNARYCRASFVQSSNLLSMLKEFERIYNYKAKKERIYFSDYMRNRGASIRDYQESSEKMRLAYLSESVSTLGGAK